MTSTVVRSGTRDDIDEITAILTDTFTEDPFFRWLFTTEESYRRLAPDYFRWMTERTVQVGDAFLAEGKGVLMGRHSSTIEADEEWAASEQHLRGICGEAADNVLASYDADRRNHPKGTPHWYAELFAVPPEHRGQGIGSLLIRQCTLKYPSFPKYCEATNPEATRLYLRAGGTVVGSYKMSDGVELTSVWWDH